MAKWVNFQIRNFNYSNIDYKNFQGWGKHVYLNIHNSYKNNNRNINWDLRGAVLKSQNLSKEVILSFQKFFIDFLSFFCNVFPIKIFC